MYSFGAASCSHKYWYGLDIVISFTQFYLAIQVWKECAMENHVWKMFYLIILPMKWSKKAAPTRYCISYKEWKPFIVITLAQIQPEWKQYPNILFSYEDTIGTGMFDQINKNNPNILIYSIYVWLSKLLVDELMQVGWW